MKKKNLINSELKNKLSNQKGFALLATLIFVFILVSLGAALLTMTNNDSKLSTLQKESTRAFYIAETGIEKALWFINFSPDNTAGLDWRTTEDDPPYYTNKELSSEEYFEVVVATDEEDIDGATKISFISTGRVDKGGEYNKGTRKIEVKLIKGIAQNNSLSYNYAIFTDSDMTINGGIYVEGDIHSNGDINKGHNLTLVNGSATASGICDYASGTSGVPKQAIPIINFEYYKAIAQGSGGVYYGDNTSKVFNTNETLTGIHFVDGDILVKADLIISDGAIFATGTITVQGNSSLTIIHSEGYNNPLAIIAEGDITMSGNPNVSGKGVIQTNGSFTLNGSVDIIGCVVAKDGVFNGGGGGKNIVYDNGLQDEIVPGTGVEVWKKASWQEVY